MASNNVHPDLTQSGDQKGNKKSKLFFFLLFSLFVCVTVIILWWLFRQKSVGDVSMIASLPATEGATKETRKLYQGQNLTFSYPGTFKQKQGDEGLREPILERAYFSEGIPDGKKIALLVQKTDYPLDEFSSYRIRTADPDTYEKWEGVIGGQKVAVFEKKTPVFEAGAFLTKEGNVASIVVSSSAKREGVRETLEALLESLSWGE